jgi:hypothetical protein
LRIGQSPEFLVWIFCESFKLTAQGYAVPADSVKLRVHPHKMVIAYNPRFFANHPFGDTANSTAFVDLPVSQT